MKPRVCAVRYLNTSPLVWGLLHGPHQDAFDLRFEEPARCAELLKAEEVDIGLVPTIELIRQRLETIPGLGICSDGPVRSILLASNVPATEIRTVAADENSRTSVELTSILLKERFGAQAVITPHAPDIGDMLSHADAGLVIGDRALRIDVRTAAPYIYDLGRLWTEWTRLPMVYAVWAARDGFDWTGASEVLEPSYNYGRHRIAKIATAEAPSRGIDVETALSYLKTNIRYRCGKRETDGLARFLSLASKHV